MKIKTICVYCGSKEGALLEYQVAAAALGKMIAEKGITLVYGGGDVGLMGTIADSVLQNNGKVIGIIPKSMYEREMAHLEITELLLVEDMHERKKKMCEMSDAFIALPGGIGTLDELAEILTWAKLEFHKKPCALLNTANYYQHLIAFFDFMDEQKFIKNEELKLQIAKSPSELLSKIGVH